jgi:hypothetical protein
MYRCRKTELTKKSYAYKYVLENCYQVNWIMAFSKLCLDNQFTSTLSFIDSEIGWNNLILVWFMCFITLLVYVLVTRLFHLKRNGLLKLKTGSKIHRRKN